MLIVRPACPGDLPSLMLLKRRASLATGEHIDDLNAHPDALDIRLEAIAHSLVAEEAGRIVGFCTVRPMSARLAEVEAMFVEPDEWRTGLGRTLLRAAEHHMAKRGVAALRVISGESAVPFYQSLGFEADGVDATRFGPATRLFKTLQTPNADADDTQ